MSASKYFQLEILDGENALALLAQLTDRARGHIGPRFKVKVRLESLDGFEYSLGDNAMTTEHEIGIEIMGLKTTDGDAWEISGGLGEDFLVQDQKLMWLWQLLSDGDLIELFEGIYDTNKRKGYIRFSM